MENIKNVLKNNNQVDHFAFSKLKYISDLLLSVLNAIVFYIYFHNLRKTVLLYIVFILFFVLKTINYNASKRFSVKNIMSTILLLAAFRLILLLGSIPLYGLPKLVHISFFAIFFIIFAIISDGPSSTRTALNQIFEAVKTLFDMIKHFSKTYWPSAIFFILSIFVLYICFIRSNLLLTLMQCFAIICIAIILLFSKERSNPIHYLRKAFFYSFFGFCAGIVLVEHTFTNNMGDTLFFIAKVFMVLEFSFLGITVPDFFDNATEIRKKADSSSSTEDHKDDAFIKDTT